MAKSPPERTPEELVFHKMYARHRLAIMAYCARRIDGAGAADACSETFLTAWRRLGDVPTEPSTLPYLYGIARNVVGNQQRSTRRKSRLVAKLSTLGVTPVADPSVVVVRRTEHVEVEAAVRGLKPTDREIVMLYTWENLSRSVIAQMMGMSKAAVDQRIHRAYKHLARTLRHLETYTFQSPLAVEEGGKA